MVCITLKTRESIVQESKVESMKSSTDFAEEIRKAYGATVNVKEIAIFMNRSEDWVRKNVRNIMPINPAERKKYYYYKEVARCMFGESICKI